MRARTAWGTGAAAIVILAAVAWLMMRTSTGAGAEPVAVRAELPRRVTVEVLNTTRVSGMARVARDAVRQAGLDVVTFGNADSAAGRPEHNEILVRRGDTTGVGRIKDAMGGAVVVDAPNRDRMVDLSVLVGTAFVQSRGPARP